MATPNRQQTLRIDAVISSSSRYQYAIYTLIIVMVSLLALLASLMWWQYAVLLVAFTVAVMGMYLSRIPLVHLSQPPLAHSVYHNWQLMLQTAHGEQLWQGNLLQAQDYGKAVLFKFAIQHPKQRLIYRLVYADQTSQQDWHKIKVLVQLVK